MAFSLTRRASDSSPSKLRVATLQFKPKRQMMGATSGATLPCPVSRSLVFYRSPYAFLVADGTTSSSESPQNQGESQCWRGFARSVSLPGLKRTVFPLCRPGGRRYFRATADVSPYMKR